jgi:hypothetical protein
VPCHGAEKSNATSNINAVILQWDFA